MIFDWPANLVPQVVSVKSPRKTVSTRSLSGLGQVKTDIRPPFGLAMKFGNLFDGEVLSYRAILAALEGRANTVRVPLFDLYSRASDAEIGAGAVTHSDGTSFSDGALYLTDDLVGVTVTGVQGQRMITVDFGDYGQLLKAGLYFGLGDRPYIATGVWWEGTVARIRHTPTLREDCTAAPLKLKPTMLCQLIDDDQGEHPLIRGRWTAPSLEFVEDFRVSVP